VSARRSQIVGKVEERDPAQTIERWHCLWSCWRLTRLGLVFSDCRIKPNSRGTDAVKKSITDDVCPRGVLVSRRLSPKGDELEILGVVLNDGYDTERS
jgi:hypothetical protein